MEDTRRGYNVAMASVKLNISGMSCGRCVAHVERALSALPGVTVCTVTIGSAEVDVDAGSAGSVPLVEAVRNAGYEARIVQ
jgi:copper chaperone CopZ